MGVIKHDIKTFFLRYIHYKHIISDGYKLRVFWNQYTQSQPRWSPMV